MGYFRYPCPGCGSEGTVHDRSCRFASSDRSTIERAYIEVLALLLGEPADISSLRSRVDSWSDVHAAALGRLQREGRITGDETLSVATGDAQAQRIIEPSIEPIATIYRYGSVPGCHDNAVFAMIAWYEMVGLSWEEARTRVLEWLEDSNTWARGGFEESTPEELVDGKRHVYEAGYGWREKAEAAKRVIERELDL